MVTYYEGHTVVITHEAVEVWWPTHRRYAVAALHGAYVSRGATAPAPVRTVGIVAVLFAMVAAALPFLSSIPVPVIGAATVVGLAVIFIVGLRSRPASWELRAIHEGNDICIYQSTDTLVFGQVKRALVRAMEGHGRVDRTATVTDQ
jgi:hypothetical protein